MVAVTKVIKCLRARSAGIAHSRRTGRNSGDPTMIHLLASDVLLAALNVRINTEDRP